MKNLIFGLLFILSLSLNAQWKGTTSNDDQRTMMVQRHMNLYPKNDQSQLKNLLTSDATININGVDVPGGVDGLAEGERMHHKIFKNIKFEVGANITSKYENGQTWTHVWAWWSGEGKKTKNSSTIPVHIAFKWNGMKATQAYMMYDPTALNNEIAANN